MVRAPLARARASRPRGRSLGCACGTTFGGPHNSCATRIRRERQEFLRDVSVIMSGPCVPRSHSSLMIGVAPLSSRCSGPEFGRTFIRNEDEVWWCVDNGSTGSSVRALSRYASGGRSLAVRQGLTGHPGFLFVRVGGSHAQRVERNRHDPQAQSIFETSPPRPGVQLAADAGVQQVTL